MPRARWLVIGALGIVTTTVVLLDVTGVIFKETPDAVPPPPLQFASPEPVAQPLSPVDLQASTPLSPRVERVIARALADPALGPEVHAVITSPSGTVLLSDEPDTPVAPASSLKLLTGLSTLDALGADSTLVTTVVHGADSESLVLVGGGDSTLSVERPGPQDPPTASLAQLAQLTRRELSASGTDEIRLSYDDSAFVGPAVSPEWEPSYVTSGVIAPVTALMADQGLVAEGSLARYPDPARAAAEDFASLLEDQGVSVLGGISSTRASGSTVLAKVESPTIGVLLQRMLRDSDNQLAEALSRVAAAQAGFPASFRGGSEAMAAAAESHDVFVDPATVYDASGLSRQDLVTADALVASLRVAATDDEFRPIIEGLPVAGVDGTLFDRFLVPPMSAAAGIVRAKTGTLTGVSTESGTAVTCAGGLVLYAFAADDVSIDTEAARDALDRAAAALTACG